MNALISLHDKVFDMVEHRLGPVLMPSLARLIFAGTLLVYFWNSGLTKLGDGVAGIVQPGFNAYAQVLPRIAESVSYDASQIGFGWKLVVLAGTWAEFILPALLILGLFTRLAALGMIGFVVVQSYVDIVGHNADASTIGTWFDATSDSLILDQRAFWVFLLLFLVVRGAGPLSLDAVLRGRAAPQTSAA
ncbi:MAG: DoxX family protein [Nioella sp.]